MTVVVIDVNDNDPQFITSLFPFEVAEDVDVNGVVGRVEASDLDEGENGLISYSFNAINQTS